MRTAMGSGAGILAMNESGPREELSGIDTDMVISFMGPRTGEPKAANRSKGSC